MIKQLFYSLVLSVSILGITSCTGSTSLIESWHDETSVDEPKLKNVLVLGIFQDDTARRAFEAKFVESVVASGGQAIAGYTLMPDESDYDDKEDIVAAVQKSNVDAVLITHLKDVSDQERYVPPRADYAPAMTYGGFYGSYYGSAYHRVYTPGYTVVDTVVSLETRVYSVNPDKLVWAGNTKSVNSASSESIAGELVKIVVDDMRSSGLIDKTL
jgi:hypothetical protein